MKKCLLVISFVLISLLAIGAVSAGDVNTTADSVAADASFDEEQFVVGELNGINDESIAGELQMGSDSGVLSEDGKSPAVDVDDVALNENDIVCVPFNVTNSDGSPVSGWVNVTISGEGKTISKCVELNNVTGQGNFTISDFMELIKAKGGNVSDIYDMILSSSNFTNRNVSDIFSGLQDINAGYAVNISSFADGYGLVVNATEGDYEKIIEGISEIINGTDINILDVIGALGEMMSGIDVDFSKIPDVTGMLIAILSGFDINPDELADDIIGGITVDMPAFINGVTALAKEYGGGASAGSISDMMSTLGLKLSLKIQIELIAVALKKQCPMSDLIRIGKEILDYNGVTVRDVFNRAIAANAFSFDVLDILDMIRNQDASKGLKDVEKITSSLSFDTPKILRSLANTIDRVTFNESRTASELASVTGIDASKLLKIIDGMADICHGFKLDSTNFLFGMMDVFMGFTSGNWDVFNDVNGAVSFNWELFIDDFDDILAEFNLTRANISSDAHDIFSKLNFTLPDALDAKLSDSLSGDRVNFTSFAGAVLEIMKYNNATALGMDTFTKLANGSAFDLSKAISKTSLDNLNVSSTVNALAIFMRYVDIDHDRIYALGDEVRNFTYDKALVARGIARMFEGADVNLSSIVIGLDKISHEMDNDGEKIIEMIDAFRSNVNVNGSKLSAGFDKLVKAFDFDRNSVSNGISKIISAFAFNRSMAYSGFEEMFDAVRFNASMIDGGIYKLANGLGINASEVVMQFIAKYGYVAVFRDILAPGTYGISVEYFDGSSSLKDTANLTVLENMCTPIRADVAVDGHNVHISGSVDSNAKGFVLIEIGDYDVYALVVDGKFAFDDVFEPGEYEVPVIYLGDFKFAKNSTVVAFTVKSQTNITSSDVSVVYANSKRIEVTLTDEKGNPVDGKKITVKINGNPYTGTTDSNGQMSVAIPSNLKPAQYTASIAFAGDSNYVKSTGSVKVVVSKATPKMAAKAKTYKRTLKTKKYTITLKNHKNKVMKNVKVTIKVNKKTYTAKTNSKGVATFKITKLTKKGTYKASVIYAGNAYYKKVTKNVNIKCK